jgi:hypothetical protein
MAGRNSSPAIDSCFGNAVFLLFALVQVADGCLTYTGTRTYGLAAEANPIIRWYMYAFGTSVALVGAKMFAVACGAVLHLAARHQLMSLLTVGYLLGAISPWVRLLNP